MSANINLQMNHMACLRLTERCADILYSLHEEVVGDNVRVAEELHNPIAQLVQCVHLSYLCAYGTDACPRRSFLQTLHFLNKLASHLFPRRYLKRNEVVCELTSCNTALSDLLGLFSVRPLPSPPFASPV